MNSNGQASLFAFGQPVTLPEVLAALPSCLNELANAAPDILGLQPPEVAAAGLAQMAAATGRSMMVDDGTHTFSMAFNLGIVCDTSPSYDWLMTLGRAWTDHAGRLEVAAKTLVPNLLRHLGEAAAPKHQVKEPAVWRSRAVRFIATCVDPSSVCEALLGSDHRAVVLKNGVLDPAWQWAQLSRIQRDRLNELLLASWFGKSVVMRKGFPEMPFSLSSLWLTHKESARLWHSKNGAMPGPVLMFRAANGSKRLPDTTAPQLVRWNRTLELAFRHRLKMEDSIVISFNIDPASRHALECFFNEFDVTLAATSDTWRPYLDWLPRLALRLCAVLLFYKVVEATEKKSSRPSHLVAHQVNPDHEHQTVERAILLARWLIQQHFQTVLSCVCDVVHPTQMSSSDSTDSLATEEVIFAKLKERGPLLPRELQRCFHKMSARERDLALMRLKSNGRVLQGSNGRLTAA